VDETVRVFEVASEDYAPELLRLRDLIDIAEATGIDPTDLGSVLRGNSGKPADRVKALAGFAWVITRRDEPDLTYDEVLDGRVVSKSENVSDSPFLAEEEAEPIS
jgi:hypothetical protein